MGYNLDYLSNFFNKHKFIRTVVKRLSAIPEVDIERVENEIRVMHKSRISRKLDSSSLSFTIDDILKAIIENQSFRSRCTEIYIELNDIVSTYNKYINFLESYILTEFPKDLEGFRSDKTKLSVCKLLFKKYYDIHERLKITLKSIEMLIEDIDKIHFDLDTVAKIKMQLYSKEVKI